jgi:hypothetical protein
MKKPGAISPIQEKLKNHLVDVDTADTSHKELISDSMPVDTIMQDTAIQKSPCELDSIAPWVYPDPSGGLHRTGIMVVLVANKPCIIEWRQGSTGNWLLYHGDSISIARSGSIQFKAVDSCGKVMEARTETYEIKPSDEVKLCPADMEYIKVGASRFCVDRYEWPNVKGKKPQAYLSIYQALDSCFSRQRRLCTTEEWRTACSGPYGWEYPYGKLYEPHACVTRDTSAHVSGSKPECRGYFALFDMSGNFAEWTNTRSNKNRDFYNVAGGFWESGSESGCASVKYSYFPQNRHNPVGFRCCKDIEPK